MSLDDIAFNEGINGLRPTESLSSGNPGISGSAASFYHADLDKVQRKLSSVHVQMYVLLDSLCMFLHSPVTKTGLLYVLPISGPEKPR